MATSDFVMNFEDRPGVPLEGFSNYIFLVPSSLTVNSDMPLTEDSGRPGQYYRNDVNDGEYKLYIDTDKSGTPVEGDLYKKPGGDPYYIYLGEDRLTQIADQFDESYKLLPAGLAAQTATVVSLTNPTPAYLGQPGRDANGKTYHAIEISGDLIWQKDIINSIKSGKNLFNKLTVEADYYINPNTGAKTPLSNYYVSEFIPILPSTDYAINKAQRFAWYDYKQVFISGIDISDNSEHTYTSPENAAYIRVSVYSLTNLNLYQLELGTASTFFEEFYEELNYQGIDVDNSTIERNSGKLRVKDDGIDGTKISSSALDDSTIEKVDNKLQIKDNAISTEKIINGAITSSKTAFLKIGKNLFDKYTTKEGKYINNANGVELTSSNYICTDYIEVIESTEYSLAYGTTAGDIHFYDINKTWLSSISKTHTFTTPSDTVYIRQNLSNNPTNWNNDKSVYQLEQSPSPTNYEPYSHEFYQSGTNKVFIRPSNLINIKNSDKIVLIGDSYSENRHTMRGKSFLAYMSMFSDWHFDNYSKSGDDYNDILTRIKNNDKTFGVLGINDYEGNYALLVSFTNDANKGVINTTDLLEEYLDDLRNVIAAVKGLGMIPVVCTEYHIHSTSPEVSDLLQSSLSELAQKEGCLFFDIARKTKYLVPGTSTYAPFWSTSHAGQRTNTIWWDNFLPFIYSLPRPRQSIKIYRRRTSYSVSTIADLMFISVFQRAKRFKEILTTQKALISAEEKYFDDLNVCPYSSVDNVHEYHDLILNNSVSFDDYALVEIIIPTVQKYLEKLNIYINDDTVDVYVKDSVNLVWYQISNYDGLIRLPSFLQYIDYDKITLLLYKSGGFSLTDLYCEWSGIEKKDYSLFQSPIIKELSTSELLTKTTVEDLTDWDITGSVTPDDPYDSILPTGITKMVILTNDDYLSQDFTFTADSLRKRKLQIKLWVRYLPTKFDYTDTFPDNSWSNTDTYDLADVVIQLIKNNYNIVYKSHYVGLHWHEILFEIDVPINETTCRLLIKSNDSKEIQLCYASVKIEA